MKNFILHYRLNKWIYSTIDEQEFIMASERVAFAVLLVGTDYHFITGYNPELRSFVSYVAEYKGDCYWTCTEIESITENDGSYNLLLLPPFTQLKSLEEYKPK